MSISEFVSGAAFGSALMGAGVYAPEVIKAQMTFSSNAMLMVMMGASATSAIVFDVSQRLGFMTKKPSRSVDLGFFPYDGNVVGGALIGIGMTSTGACPGTAIVQMGVGMPTGFLVAAGGVLGAYFFRTLQPTLKQYRKRMQSNAEIRSSKNLDIATWLGISPSILLIVWVAMCLSVMRLLFVKDRTARRAPDSGFVPASYSGLLIGAAQLATTFFTHHAIGASRAFEDVAQWLEKKVRHTSSTAGAEPKLLSSSVLFSCGIMGAAAALNYTILGRNSLDALKVSVGTATAAQAIAGGCAMVLGARMAGGCTSGHGISGMAQFWVSSLITTGAMFSAGIATAKIVG